MQAPTIATASSGSPSRPPTPPRRWTITVGPLTIDPYTREVEVDGVPVHLAKKEYGLLLALAENPVRVVPREELLHRVWGIPIQPGYAPPTRTVDSHAARLRKKLAAPAGHTFVVNVWGVGYRLTDPGSGDLGVLSPRREQLQTAVGALDELAAGLRTAGHSRHAERLKQLSGQLPSFLPVGFTSEVE